MKTKNQRERAKVQYSDAKKRTEEHESGFEPTAYKLPEGTERFKFDKVGNFRLDVLPFICNGNNPFADEGSAHYERTYYVHRGIGPEQKTYTCPRKTFGKRCPICDECNKLRRDPSTDREAIKELEPKERQLFLFLDHANRDKGPMVYDTAHYMSFGALLDEKVSAIDEDDEHLKNFFHLEDGMSLKVTVKEDTFQGRKYMKPVNIEFIPRSKALPEDMLDSNPSLDELPIEMPYDKLKAIFLQEDTGDTEEEEDEDSPPAKSSKKPAPKPEPEDDDEDQDDDATAEDKGIEVGSKVHHEEYGDCEVIHISGDGTSLRLRDEEEEVHRGIAPADCELIEEEEDEPTPAKKPAKKPSAKKPEPEDDDEDDEEEEDDDDDPPAKKPAKFAAKSEPEDDEDDEDGWDDEEDEPAPAKKPAKKPGKK